MKKYKADRAYLQTHLPELFESVWGETQHSGVWEYNNSEAVKILTEAFFEGAEQKASQIFSQGNGWCDTARLENGKRIAIGGQESLTSSGDFYIVELD
jgi:hypothetical protein